jgi:leader peptidase (prepilin peptidase) / N-methyltransferase
MSEMLELLARESRLLALVTGLLGLAVGSFLNVLIHRLPKMLEREWRRDALVLAGSEPPATPPYNLVRPPSACPSCGAPIRFWQNVPILSWLWLRGRCAACRAPISARYPLVELLTGILSGLIAWRYGLSDTTLWALLFTWIAIALTWIDFDHQLLPDNLTLLLLWLGLFAAVVSGRGAAGFPVEPRAAIVGALVGYLSLWSIYHLFRLLTGKEGMGYGDFKLFAAIGAWLGWQMLIPVILFAAAAGTLIYGALILLRRHDRGQAFGFGPFLAIAGWLVMIWPQVLVASWWPLAH